MTATDKLGELLELIKCDGIMDYLTEDSPEELERCLEIFREFAKFHVQEALKNASMLNFDDIDHPEANDYEQAIKLNIQESYPLDNIK